MRYRIVPITLRAAKEFVDNHHRHNVSPQGHKFSIGLEVDNELVGVAIVGRPIARNLDDGFTAEITRCCVLDGMNNANSKLYGAAVRSAKSMGFTRIVTYTLPNESGSSLKASGFIQDGVVRGRDWNCPSRPRKTLTQDKYPSGDKIRWIHH